MKTYLAQGDSMSIDTYTGQAGGGGVSRFAALLGPGWSVVDRSFDGCLMQEVDVTPPPGPTPTLVTLTIGGNDLLGHLERYLESGDLSELGTDVIDAFASEHRALLLALRASLPTAHLVVANIYRPDLPLPPEVIRALDDVNDLIARHVAEVGGALADVHAALAGQEAHALTEHIEPNLAGAALIARAFADAAVRLGIPMEPAL
jgi:lysophospholipase L1-like esterase